MKARQIVEALLYGTDLPQGTRVRISQFHRSPDYRGKTGTVEKAVQFDRAYVNLDDGERVLVNRADLLLLDESRLQEATKNPMCDGSHCVFPEGEVRVLPTGGDGNSILCRSCFNYEMLYRRSRNRELGSAGQFQLPAWESLKVYDSGE